MGEQKITAVIEDRRIIFKFDVTKKLSDLRKYLIDEKYIVIDAEEDTWRFYKVKDSKVSKTEDMDEEKYIPVCEYIYDTDKILVGNLKKSLNVFADTLHEFFRFDVSNNLEDLRKYLIDKKFITADEELSAWRFVSPSAKDLKNVTEAIIGIQSEDKMVVKDFLYGSNKVRMVNVNRKKNPDLIGVDADYLLNRDIEVRIIRNDSVSPDKLAPIIMTNVRPANKLGIRTDFENVVLCEKETAIGIRISTRTHGGFIYSIKLQEGKDIRGKGYSPHTGFTTYAYEGTRNAIKVVSYKDLEIPTQQAVGYRRVTVNVWRFISYVDCDTGKKFIVDDNAPKPKARAMSILSGGVDVVTGDSIEGGGFVEGGDTENYISGCIQDIVEDENELLGTFEIDFFVFKTAEDAQNMVESRINPEYE